MPIASAPAIGGDGILDAISHKPRGRRLRWRELIRLAAPTGLIIARLGASARLLSPEMRLRNRPARV